MKTKKNHRN